VSDERDLPADFQPAEPGLRVRLDLAYEGTDFHGWQIQSGLRTVQGELSRMVADLLGRTESIWGAGRTDAGVHARGQVGHLTVRDGAEVARLKRALASRALDDLEILAVRQVSPDFHARFSAQARRYSYHLRLRRDIFRRHLGFHVARPLDQAAMDAAARFFLGTHDFSSFCKTQSLKPGDNECTVDLCCFEWLDDSSIFHVRADRFLHNMVRNLVGTVLEVGLGRRSPDEMPAILLARDRSQAGRKAPAQGLFLEEVTYPPELLDPAFRLPAGARATPGQASTEGETA